MPEEIIHQKAPPFVFPNYHIRFCRSHFARSIAADATGLHNRGMHNSIQRNAVYCDLCRLRHRTCGAGYRKLLVRLRPGCHSCTDTDRRTWRCNSCSIVRIAVRTKNLSDAAQHHAGRNFRSKGWRSCPTDAVYPSRYIFN